MKKRMALLLVSALAAGSIAGCSSSDTSSSSSTPASDKSAETSAAASASKAEGEVAEGETYDFQLAHSSPADVPSDQASYKFLEVCNELSGGRMTGKVYENSQLGSEREEFEAIQMGNIQLAMLSTGPIVNFAPEYYLCDFPFPFNGSRERAFEVLDGEVGTEIKNSVESVGAYNLGWWENGFRNLTCNDEKRKPEDFKGMKIRTMENDIHMKIWTDLGANPTPMAFGEVYTALQQKTIDAQENPYTLIDGMRFYEVNKYIVNTKHLFSPHCLFMNKELLDGMSAEDQEIIRTAAEEATKFQRETAVSYDEKILQTLKDNGCTVVDLTDEERQTLVDATADVDEMIREKVGNDELFEKFQAEVRAK